MIENDVFENSQNIKNDAPESSEMVEINSTNEIDNLDNENAFSDKYADVDNSLLESNDPSNENNPSISENMKTPEKLTKFQISRIKRIMMMDSDVHLISKEALFLITKALELFVQSLAWEAGKYTLAAHKKTVTKLHIEEAIDGVESLAFLDGAMDD